MAKSKLTRLQRAAEKQLREHTLAAFFILAVSLSFYLGTTQSVVYLPQTVFQNTNLPVGITATTTWYSSNGSVIPNFDTATVSGVLVCKVAVNTLSFIDTDGSTYTLRYMLMSVYAQSGSGWSGIPTSPSPYNVSTYAIVGSKYVYSFSVDTSKYANGNYKLTIESGFTVIASGGSGGSVPVKKVTYESLFNNGVPPESPEANLNLSLLALIIGIPVFVALIWAYSYLKKRGRR